MSENILEQLKDWGLTAEQLVKLVADLKSISDGNATINFLGNGNHTVVVGNYFASGGGGKTKKSRRSSPAHVDDPDEIQPDNEVEQDDRNLEPESTTDDSRDELPQTAQVDAKAQEAYIVLLGLQDDLVNFEYDQIDTQAIANAGCAQEIIDNKHNEDKVDNILERYFPDPDA